MPLCACANRDCAKKNDCAQPIVSAQILSRVLVRQNAANTGTDTTCTPPYTADTAQSVLHNYYLSPSLSAILSGEHTFSYANLTNREIHFRSDSQIFVAQKILLCMHGHRNLEKNSAEIRAHQN